MKTLQTTLIFTIATLLLGFHASNHESSDYCPEALMDLAVASSIKASHELQSLDVEEDVNFKEPVKNLRIEGDRLMWDRKPGDVQYKVDFSIRNEDQFPAGCEFCDRIQRMPNQVTNNAEWTIPSVYANDCFVWRVWLSSNSKTWQSPSKRACYDGGGFGDGRPLWTIDDADSKDESHGITLD